MKIVVTVLSYIRSLFFKGLFALLPITLTFVLINFALKTTKHFLEPVMYIMPHWMRVIPYIEIVVVFMAILGIGLLLNSFIIAEMAHYMMGMVERIPLVKQIYVSIKQLVNVLSAQDNGAYKDVVLIEFPSKGSYALGFLTGQFPSPLSPRKDVVFYNVFIPASPNPTSGFYVILAEGDFMIIDLSRQEAMKLIISGGIIIPERFNGVSSNEGAH